MSGFAALTLGEWVLGTTIAVYAYGAGGALAVGLIGFRFAPAAVAGLWTTQLASHARHRPVLSLTATTRALITAMAALALGLGLPFGLVVALVWLDAAAGSGYRPAQAALLPTVARTPGELTIAVGLVSSVKTAGQMLGALLGGVLVVALPIAPAVACAVVLYALAAAATATRTASRTLATPLLGLHGMLRGVSNLRHNASARIIVAYSCLRSLMRGLWLALAVVASFRLLSLGRSGLGSLMAAAALGALFGLAATVRLVGRRRLARWFAAGLVFCGLPIAVIGVVGVAWVALVLMVVWGTGMALADVCAQALLNRVVAGRSIGAVTGAMESGKLLFEGVGGLLAAGLVVALGIRAAMIVVGLALPLLVALGYRRLSRVDARARARVDVLELLQAVPFFVPLRVDALEGVAARLVSERVAAGHVVVREGEVDAGRWFLVSAGELVVEVDGFVVGRLYRGSQFGERSLLRGVARSATVRAATDVALYALERDDFLSAVSGVDLVEQPAGLDGRPAQLDATSALARAPLIHSLGPAALGRLVRDSVVHELAAGTAIVTLGEHDDRYHVLLGGLAQVIVGGEPRRDLLPGDAFGEIAVLHRVARTATVIAREPCTILTLEGEAVRTALREHAGGELAALAG